MRLVTALRALFGSLKKVVGFCIAGMQGFDVYGKVGRLLRPHIVVREASERDLTDVERWVGPGSALSQGQPMAMTVTHLVAEKGTRIVGYVQLVNRLPSFGAHSGYWLCSMAVRLLHRRLGIGERLCGAALERARTAGAAEVSLLVREDNRPAMNLYRKLGFEMKVVPAIEAELEKEKLALGHRRVLMGKRIPGPVEYPETRKRPV